MYMLLKALLGSFRNLFWMEFQSLAPNLAKDLWFRLQLEDLI